MYNCVNVFVTEAVDNDLVCVSQTNSVVSWLRPKNTYIFTRASVLTFTRTSVCFLRYSYQTKTPVVSMITHLFVHLEKMLSLVQTPYPSDPVKLSLTKGKKTDSTCRPCAVLPNNNRHKNIISGCFSKYR